VCRVSLLCVPAAQAKKAAKKAAQRERKALSVTDTQLEKGERSRHCMIAAGNYCCLHYGAWFELEKGERSCAYRAYLPPPSLHRVSDGVRY
jgi:hypothetical protein